MTQREVLTKFKSQFNQFLQELGSSKYRIVSKKGNGADLILEARIRGAKKILLVGCKSLGQPRFLRQAIAELRTAASEYPGAYPLVVAPYIPEQSLDLIKENNMGFFDLAGNCLITFDKVYLRSKGYPNPNPTTRALRSLFGPKASRIVRVLLSQPEREWTVQELAKRSSTSLGWASGVKKKLLDFEYVKEVDRRLRLTKPAELLDEWARNYSYTQNEVIPLFALAKSVGELEQRLEAVCSERGRPYAFTSFSAAARRAPFVRYSTVYLYFSGDVSLLEKELDLKRVPSGANLMVLVPYDEGVYYGSRTVGGIQVVSDIQLYLDLVTNPARGEEAARALREQALNF